MLHQRVEEVLLYCTVLDHRGQLVNDLEGPAFTVLEDKKPVAVTHFARKDVPVSLALILDDSGSMKEKRTAVQNAALTLIKAPSLGRRNFRDELCRQTLSRPGTHWRRVKARAGAQGDFNDFGRNSTLRHGHIGADHLAASAHRSKQVIVLVTDGNDNASEADLIAAIRRVREQMAWSFTPSVSCMTHPVRKQSERIKSCCRLPGTRGHRVLPIFRQRG